MPAYIYIIIITGGNKTNSPQQLVLKSNHNISNSTIGISIFPLAKLYFLR